MKGGVGCVLCSWRLGRFVLSTMPIGIDCILGHNALNVKNMLNHFWVIFSYRKCKEQVSSSLKVRQDCRLRKSLSFVIWFYNGNF